MFARLRHTVQVVETPMVAEARHMLIAAMLYTDTPDVFVTFFADACIRQAAANGAVKILPLVS